MSNPTEPLALEIKAEMTRQRLTAADVASRCSLSVSQVTRRLAGTVDLTVADALVITDALGVPLYKMLERALPIEAAA
jgi:transcriptional regulator with XRE-family HTH domain